MRFIEQKFFEKSAEKLLTVILRGAKLKALKQQRRCGVFRGALFRFIGLFRKKIRRKTTYEKRT